VHEDYFDLVGNGSPANAAELKEAFQELDDILAGHSQDFALSVIVSYMVSMCMSQECPFAALTSFVHAISSGVLHFTTKERGKVGHA
jgi:hypothetical protein